MVSTLQEEFWAKDFGKEYTERNIYSTHEALDNFYKGMIGLARSDMNKEFLSNLEINNILEVGCNIGNQLNMLQYQGYKNLYGIDIQSYAVQKAKELTKDVNIIEGSIFDIPFKDKFFDLVFTSGVLIHISPNDIKRAMREIYRVSKRYIWGYEYFDDDYREIEYRGNKDRLWKGNYSEMYRELFSDLVLIKEKKYSNVGNDNVDVMYLLEKK